MALRFLGQQTTMSIINTTTRDRVLQDLKFKSFGFTVLTEVKSDLYLGDVGPEVVMMFNGYEFTLEWDPSNAIQLVDFLGLIINKSKRLISDEFALRSTFSSPDGGKFASTFKDPAFDSPSFDMPGQQDFLKSSLKGKGKDIGLQRL